MFKLQFDIKKIPELADRYVSRLSSLPKADSDDVALAAAAQGRQDGYLTKKSFLDLCRWKSPRLLGHAKSNSPSFIKEATAVAFSTKHEELKMGALTALSGVGYPMASAILHLVHENQYPLLDFRALWSLGIEKPPQYNFRFWWAYVEACRSIASEAGKDMRMVDRALWQFSFENQKQ